MNSSKILLKYFLLFFIFLGASEIKAQDISPDNQNVNSSPATEETSLSRSLQMEKMSLADALLLDLENIADELERTEKKIDRMNQALKDPIHDEPSRKMFLAKKKELSSQVQQIKKSRKKAKVKDAAIKQ